MEWLDKMHLSIPLEKAATQYNGGDSVDIYSLCFGWWCEIVLWCISWWCLWSAVCACGITWSYSLLVRKTGSFTAAVSKF